MASLKPERAYVLRPGETHTLRRTILARMATP